MRATTIRFSEDLWEMLEREAATQEISTAQLIRDAALLRVSALASRRGDRDLGLSVEELAERSTRRRATTSDSGDLHDPDRLAAVHATGLANGQDDQALDKLASLARTMLNASAALITLIDADRQIFVSSPGLKEPWSSRGHSPLEYSFCRSAAIDRDPVMISDARSDSALRSHPAVEEMGVVAYLGVPLITNEGHGIGALCVNCDQPRVWSEEQVDMLKTLARAVLDHICVSPA